MCYMEKSSWLDGLLEYLKEKNKISEIEADILSTIEAYVKDPFDRSEAEYKITKNNYKYMNLCAAISLQTGSNSKPFNYLSTDDIKHTLYLQIKTMSLMARLDIESFRRTI